MDLRAQAVIGEVLLVGLRAVGRVGPQVARGIVLRDEVRQLRAIVAGRVRRRPGPDQTMPPVDAYVGLISERRHPEGDARGPVVRGLCLRELDRPARIPILLCELRGLVLPRLRNAPGLEVGLLSGGIALLGAATIEASMI